MHTAIRESVTLHTRLRGMLPEDFTSLLLLYLRRKKLKNAEFSRAIGRSQNYTSGLVSGHHGPPLDELKTWGRVLGLNAEEFQEFEEEASLAHCPPLIVQRYREMKKRLKP